MKSPITLALSITKAPTIKITSPDTLSRATEELSTLNLTLDALTADKELITKPLNLALKEARLKYKPAEDALNARIGDIRLAMQVYATKAIYASNAKKEALAGAIASGDLSLDKAMTKLSTLKDPLARVEVSSGSLSFIAKPTLKVTDLKAIPREYFTLNESQVLADLKAGKEVAGACIEIIQVPRNSR